MIGFSLILINLVEWPCNPYSGQDSTIACNSGAQDFSFILNVVFRVSNLVWKIRREIVQIWPAVGEYGHVSPDGS